MVNNLPLTGYEPNLFDDFHYSETTEIFLQEQSSDTMPSYLHDAELSDETTNQPTNQPSNLPTFQPSNHPTIQPSNHPTIQPSNHGGLALTSRVTQYQAPRAPLREESKICVSHTFQQRSPPAQPELRRRCPTPGDPLNNDHDTNEFIFDALNVVLTRRLTLELQILVSWGTWGHKHGGQPLMLPKSVALRSKEGQKKPQCAQCGKRHHGQRRTRSYTSTHRESLTGGWKGGGKGDGKGTQKGGNPRKGETQGKGKVIGKKGQRLNELRELPEEQWASGSWEQWSEQSWPTEAGSVSWREADGLEARESCAPSMHQESQRSWKVQKSTVDDC